MKYIWQKENWINFKWNNDEIIDTLSKARKAQGMILGKGEFFDLKELGFFLIEEALNTSYIEGENIDRDSIRSSVARRLGLPTAGLPSKQVKADGLVEILIDATSNYSQMLNSERICNWQAALFPTGYSGINKIKTGKWRENSIPMRVISGSMKNEKIHFQAPPSEHVQEEIQHLVDWWNNKSLKMDGIIRAAIAHFWFVTIHPFEDGNGRIARVLTDMALAQDEKMGKRLYSLSTQINKEKVMYYGILEGTQKGNGDLTLWINWFLKMYTRSIESSEKVIEKSLFINSFYKKIVDLSLNQRQLKVINKLIESYPEEFDGGLTNKKYVSMTKTSTETAKRDIKILMDKKIVLKNASRGRSTSYRLNKEL